MTEDELFEDVRYWKERAAAAEAMLSEAVEIIKPFAMLCTLDVQESDGDLTSVYPMVAAGRLRAARDFINAPVKSPSQGADNG